MYLLDTNVLSELRKQKRCKSGVLAWIEPIHPDDLFISVLSLGEIRNGVELIGRRDARSAQQLAVWLSGLYNQYANRIVEIDAAIAEEWGKVNAVRPVGSADGLIASTAIVRGFKLVTRDEQDFKGLPVNVINPFV